MSDEGPDHSPSDAIIGGGAGLPDMTADRLGAPVSGNMVKASREGPRFSGPIQLSEQGIPS